MTQEQALSYSIHLFQSAETCKETYKKTIVLWCLSTAFHASNLEPFDVPDTLKYITNQSRTLVMANSHCLLPWWLKAPHSESNTKAERHTVIRFEPICARNTAINSWIQRDIKSEIWRDSFELPAAERQTAARWGTGRVPRRVMEWGQKGGTERFEVIICKVCPRGEEKMLWTSILHSAACMGRTRTHKHANTGCTHKPEIDLSSCAGEGGRY